MSEASEPQASDLDASDLNAPKPNAAAPTRREPPMSQPGGSESVMAQPSQVGPGRPPRDGRWKKGGPSPNPRGRPRKDRTMLPDVKKAFEQALNKKIAVTRGDRSVLMNRLEIGFEQLLNQFAKGDRYARRDLMQYADKLGIDLLASEGRALEQALMPNHQAILDAFLARRRDAVSATATDPIPAAQESVAAPRQRVAPQREPVSTPRQPVSPQREPVSPPAVRVSAPPQPVLAPRQPVLAQREPVSSPGALVAAAGERVFAPPELLDDEVAQGSAAKPEATLSPAPEIKPEVALPTPMPGKDYPKPPERMTIGGLRAWYPDWYAQYGHAWEKQRLEKRRLESLRPAPGRRIVQ